VILLSEVIYHFLTWFPSGHNIKGRRKVNIVFLRLPRAIEIFHNETGFLREPFWK
jgi:hypothetical protein